MAKTRKQEAARKRLASADAERKRLATPEPPQAIFPPRASKTDKTPGDGVNIDGAAGTMLDKRRDNARKAREALAKKRAAGNYVASPRRKARADSFLGRIEQALARIDKTRPDLVKHLGLTSGYLAHFNKVGHEHYRLKPERMQQAADFLGVSVEWLDKGEGKPDWKATPVVAVNKANGAHVLPQGDKLAAAMHASADTAMQSVWDHLAIDVKLFLIARATELLGQHLRRGR